MEFRSSEQTKSSFVSTDSKVWINHYFSIYCFSLAMFLCLLVSTWPYGFFPSFRRSFFPSFLRFVVPSLLSFLFPLFFLPLFLWCFGASLLVLRLLLPLFLRVFVSSRLSSFLYYNIYFPIYNLSVYLGERTIRSSSSHGNKYKPHRCFTHSGLCPNLRQ